MLPIRRPYRKPIPAAEGEPAHRGRSGKIVNPHIRFFAIIDSPDLKIISD
jgi:hypothetical protein